MLVKTKDGHRMDFRDKKMTFMSARFYKEIQVFSEEQLRRGNLIRLELDNSTLLPFVIDEKIGILNGTHLLLGRFKGWHFVEGKEVKVFKLEEVKGVREIIHG